MFFPPLVLPSSFAFSVSERKSLVFQTSYSFSNLNLSDRAPLCSDKTKHNTIVFGPKGVTHLFDKLTKQLESFGGLVQSFICSDSAAVAEFDKAW
jgi:hypothetical protein